MPSRTRIVLRRNDGESPITNESAKRFIISVLAEGIIWKTGLPEGWAKLKMRGKLEYLKNLFPPGWVLEVYTEPRATRPMRSVYKSQFVKEGGRKAPRNRGRVLRDAIPLHDEPPVDQQPPQTQQQQVGDNFRYEWLNAGNAPVVRRP